MNRCAVILIISSKSIGVMALKYAFNIRVTVAWTPSTLGCITFTWLREDSKTKEERKKQKKLGKNKRRRRRSWKNAILYVIGLGAEASRRTCCCVFLKLIDIVIYPKISFLNIWILNEGLERGTTVKFNIVIITGFRRSVRRKDVFQTIAWVIVIREACGIWNVCDFVKYCRYEW